MLKGSDHPVQLDDCSDYSFGERFYSFLDQYGGKDHNKRIQIYDIAWQAAQEEMLNEIHCMLRYLVKEKQQEENDKIAKMVLGR